MHGYNWWRFCRDCFLMLLSYAGMIVVAYGGILIPAKLLVKLIN